VLGMVAEGGAGGAAGADGVAANCAVAMRAQAKTIAQHSVPTR